MSTLERTVTVKIGGAGVVWEPAGRGRVALYGRCWCGWVDHAEAVGPASGPDIEAADAYLAGRVADHLMRTHCETGEVQA